LVKKKRGICPQGGTKPETPHAKNRVDKIGTNKVVSCEKRRAHKKKNPRYWGENGGSERHTPGGMPGKSSSERPNIKHSKKKLIGFLTVHKWSVGEEKTKTGKADWIKGVVAKKSNSPHPRPILVDGQRAGGRWPES